MASDADIGKKEIEREQLANFLDAYARVAGETLPEIFDSETPDFVGFDRDGRGVGIEIVRLKFPPDHMFWRRVHDHDEYVDSDDAFGRVLEILHDKENKLGSGAWPKCQRKILVIVLIDCPIHELMPIETDTLSRGGFDEIWLSDETRLEAFGGVDLFPILHPRFSGLFDVSSRDQKPYG